MTYYNLTQDDYIGDYINKAWLAVQTLIIIYMFKIHTNLKSPALCKTADKFTSIILELIANKLYWSLFIWWPIYIIDLDNECEIYVQRWHLHNGSKYINHTCHNSRAIYI